jgi:two-component system cell cycle sensor histidine kinase/response regulator CckA
MDKKELDLRRIEEQLFSTQKTENLGLLAGRVAHDLNNLLTVILGNIEILKYLPSIAGNPPSEIAYISEAAQKAAELTHRMLRLAGKGPDKPQSTDINAIIDEYLPVLLLAVPKSIPISAGLYPDLPEIRVHRVQIEQALLNLVINSGEALQDKSGKINITTGKKTMDAAQLAASVLEDKPPAGRFIFITVSDTGPGIESENLPRVFEPFFSTKPGGRGLGLTVLKGIIRSCRGALFLESAPGKGTRVTILFPIGQAADAETSQTASGEDAEKRLSGTFIVADDEPIVLRILIKILESIGLTIIPAKTGGEVIDLYHKHAGEVDGLILDVSMPGKNGIECFEELRKINPSIKVILASGAGEVKNIKSLLADGIFSYVPKPYTLEDLEQEIRKLLATGDGRASK